MKPHVFSSEGVCRRCGREARDTGEICTPYLPHEWVAKGVELAQTATLLGSPLASLSRAELLAAAAHGWQAYERLRADRSGKA